MKLFNLFLLVIICIAYVRADKCDYENFKECLDAIKGVELLVVNVGGKSAKSQCPTDICKNVRRDYTDCLKTTWKNNKDYSNSISKNIAAAFEQLTIYESIICEKDGDKYCYDEYKNNILNLTRREEINCSKCGKKLNENLQIIRLSILDENDPEYEQKKKEIKEYNICNGALANASLKIFSILLISVVSSFFLF